MIWGTDGWALHSPPRRKLSSAALKARGTTSVPHSGYLTGYFSGSQKLSNSRVRVTGASSACHVVAELSADDEPGILPGARMGPLIGFLYTPPEAGQIILFLGEIKDQRKHGLHHGPTDMCLVKGNAYS